MKIFLVFKSYNLYPLYPRGYPTKIEGVALGLNLSREEVRVEANAKQPKTRSVE